jgi:hypothetical protein
MLASIVAAEESERRLVDVVANIVGGSDMEESTAGNWLMGVNDVAIDS